MAKALILVVRLLGLAALILFAGLACTGVTPTPNMPATVEAEVGRRVSAQMAVVPATITAQVATRVASIPTATAYPTYTPYPSPTWVPTSTPTLIPTATLLPTNTPLPTLTPTVKWGLTNDSVPISDLTFAGQYQDRSFILQGCYTGVGKREFGRTFLFSEGGEFESGSKFVVVQGFAPGDILSHGVCYEMGVSFKKVVNYCFYQKRSPDGYLSLGNYPCSGWTHPTLVYRLLTNTSWERE